jgi:hypothetical protein
VKKHLKDEVKDLVVIEWLDHYHFPGWNRERPQDPLQPVRLVTVGWIVEEDKDVVLLAETKAWTGKSGNGYGQLRGVLKKGIISRSKL